MKDRLDISKHTEEIFYPNKLQQEDVCGLLGWQLRVAALHFGCRGYNLIRNGYGYISALDVSGKEKIWIAADNNTIYKLPLLFDETIGIRENSEILAECGISVAEILKNHICKALKEWFSDKSDKALLKKKDAQEQLIRQTIHDIDLCYNNLSLKNSSPQKDPKVLREEFISEALEIFAEEYSKI